MSGSGAAQISTWHRKDDLGRQEILHPQQRNRRAKFILLETICGTCGWRVHGFPTGNQVPTKACGKIQFLNRRESQMTFMYRFYTPFLADARKKKKSTLTLCSNRYN